MKKKFKLTNESKEIDGVTVYRIKALRSFGSVKKGDKGGWLQREVNLSHYSDCWVRDNAVVRGYAEVCGNAVVRDKALVRDYGVVCGNALVRDYGEVRATALVRDYVNVSGNALVRGHVNVSGNVLIRGSTVLSGDEE